MTMKLYYASGACSLAVHIALRETGADFEPLAVDLASHRLGDGSSYLDVAPRGYVPMLELPDGSRHTEVAALLQFVADRAPGHGLVGAPGSMRRLAVLEWLAFVATELHKNFYWLWHKETAESTRQAVKDKLAVRFEELERHLSRHDHLAEGGYSVANAYAFTILNWTRFLGVSIARYPHLQAYLARVAARPAVQAALRVEGLLK